VTALSEHQRPRTLTEALRAMSAEQMSALLELRPDLLDPVPHDIAELGSRSTMSTSIARAIEELNAWLRTVAEALAALPDPASLADLATILGQPGSPVAAAIGQLRLRALLWGEDDQIHLVRPVREAFEPYPGGLAPPSARPMSTEQIEAALEDCGAEARVVLERLLWSPTGAVRYADRPVSRSSARSPIERLLSRQLLRPLDSETVIIPREVAWRLRDGRFTAEPVAAEQQQLTGQDRDPRLVDRAAAGAAFALLQDIELLAHRLEAAPHKLLRAGGLPSRDVNALARHLGAEPDHASFLIECAAAAHLIAPASTTALLPTPAYDQWLGQDAPSRWWLVTRAWLEEDRFFGRSAEAGSHTLGQEAYARGAAGLRRTVVRILADAKPGTTLDLAQLATAASWHRPSLAQGPVTARQLVEWTCPEASWLGLAALGAVSSFIRFSLQSELAMPSALQDLFPAPVEHFIIQTDLTAVTSGPLEHAVAAELRLLADQESRGGAGVYRFSPATLRRAFDQGWSAAEVQSWLARHSTTDVPQALGYLIEDVARRHASVRIGPAACYVRISDAAQAAALLAHPDASRFGLRAVAPHVLIAAVDEYELLPLLQELGHSPAVENAAGDVMVTPPTQRADKHLAESKPVRSAAQVADALLAGEGSRQVAMRVGAGPTTADVGLSISRGTVARSIE
jgi:Helicase conserved C-terminal domain